MLKSEGHSISPSPKRSPSAKFSCATRKDLGALLGKGKQGIVYKCKGGFAAKICPRDLVAAASRQKQPADVEFSNHKEIYAAAPDGVVAVYDLVRCLDFIPPSALNSENLQNAKKYDKSKQSIIFMEYCSGGNLTKWLSAKPRSDTMIRHVIKSVLTTLANIKKKYPEFRHNDLHMDNVMVADRGFLIGDFGWSRTAASGTNPAVNTANGTKTAGYWGVGPKTDPRYDTHQFLAHLREWVTRQPQLTATREFLDHAIPMGYRSHMDVHTSEGRLKYGDPCKDLPTLEVILKSKYLTGRKFNSPNLAEARLKLKKVHGPVPLFKSANLQKAKARLKKARVKSANLQKAKARLKKVRVKGRRAHGIRSANLLAAKARLKKVPKKVAAKNATARVVTRVNTGVVARKRVPIPRAVLKSNAFNRLVEKIRLSQSPKRVLKSNGQYVNEGYNNARDRARTKAMNQVSNRINRGMDPFSQSPLRPRAPSPPRVKNLPKRAPLVKKAAIILVKTKPAAPKPNRPKAILLNAPVNNKYRRSPKSGRMKMKANSGRWVYVNLHMGLEDLKKLAASKHKNITGLRTKADIIRKIFN
jgi:serine/threonine protein kinase